MKTGVYQMKTKKQQRQPERQPAQQLQKGGVPIPNSILLVRAGLQNRTGMSDALKQRFESKSGLSLDNVRVHRNSDEPAKYGALAFTRGTDIYLGQGQEEHLPHELGHVVQQKLGKVKPMAKMGGAWINYDSSLETDADRILNAPVNTDAVPVQATQPVGDVMQMKWPDRITKIFSRKNTAPKLTPAQQKQQQIQQLKNQYLTAKQDALLQGNNVMGEEQAEGMANRLFEIQKLLSDESSNEAYDDMRTFIMKEFFDVSEEGPNADPARKAEFEKFWGKRFVELGQTKTGRSLMSQIYERRYGANAKKIEIGENEAEFDPSQQPKRRLNRLPVRGYSEATYDRNAQKMQPGGGDDAVVYLPDLDLATLLYENTKGPQKYAPLVSAAHELTHGLHTITGTALTGYPGPKGAAYPKPDNDKDISLEEYATTMFGEKTTEDPTAANEQFFVDMFTNANDSQQEKEKFKKIFSVNEQRFREDFGMPKADSYTVRHYNPRGQIPGYITPKEYKVFQRQEAIKKLAREGLSRYTLAKRFNNINEKTAEDIAKRMRPFYRSYRSLDERGKALISRRALDPRTGKTRDEAKSYIDYMNRRKKPKKEDFLPL